MFTVGQEHKPHKLTPHEKAHCYHQMLSTILKSYISVQQSGGLHNVQITLGNITKTVMVKVPCGIILGDMQGGDKHCGSCIGYSTDLS